MSFDENNDILKKHKKLNNLADYAWETDDDEILHLMGKAAEAEASKCANCECSHQGEHTPIGSCICGCDIYQTLKEKLVIYEAKEKQWLKTYDEMRNMLMETEWKAFLAKIPKPPDEAAP